MEKTEFKRQKDLINEDFKNAKTKKEVTNATNKVKALAELCTKEQEKELEKMMMDQIINELQNVGKERGERQEPSLTVKFVKDNSRNGFEVSMKGVGICSEDVVNMLEHALEKAKQYAREEE